MQVPCTSLGPTPRAKIEICDRTFSSQLPVLHPIWTLRTSKPKWHLSHPQFLGPRLLPQSQRQPWSTFRTPLRTVSSCPLPFKASQCLSPPVPVGMDILKSPCRFHQTLHPTRSQKRISKRPKPLTAAQHAALRERLKGRTLSQARLRRQFQDQLSWHPAKMEEVEQVTKLPSRSWKLLTDGRYCEFAELGPWQEVIENPDRPMAMDFLHHLCEKVQDQLGGPEGQWELWPRERTWLATPG
jgi:hypothetical protein